MNKTPIAFAFDNNLVFPACICLSSLMMHAKEDTFYDIFILHSENEELNHQELDKLPSFYPNCKIQYRCVGDIFDKAFEIRGITTPAYYRLLIPELIPEYDKVIYSDVDVIFRMDLTELYSQDLGHNYIAATYWLGRCYKEGIGVEQSESNARLYYQISAEAGDADAQYAYGMLFMEDADSSPYILKKAIEWLQRAADKGHEEAIEKIKELKSKNNL